MTDSIESLTSRIVAAKQVTADDVLALRKAIWSTDRIKTPIVAALFAINDAITAPLDEFSDCFSEAITHFLLKQDWPHDFMSDENANWLMSAIDKDGKVESHAELELLVRVVEKAENAPETLKTYAQTQLEAVILTGEGPTRRGGAIHPGTIDTAEVALLRRLVFAAGGGDASKVGASEAELLFRIKDATIGKSNAPEWETLFVQGIANHLMAHSSYVALSRERAAELNKVMDDASPNIGGFLSRIAGAISLDALFKSSTAKAAEDHDAVVEADLQIAADEAAWLKRQIAADGATDALEKAVLAFIIDEGVKLPGELDEIRKSA